MDQDRKYKLRRKKTKDFVEIGKYWIIYKYFYPIREWEFK